MASRPAKWRILAVTNGVDLPNTGEATPSRPGPLQEFADLAASEAEVSGQPTPRAVTANPGLYLEQGTLAVEGSV